MKMNKTALTLLAGLGAGVAIGLWLSTENSRKFRKKITTSLNDLSDDLRQKLVDQFAELKTKVGEIKDKGITLKEKVALAVKDLKEETKQKIMDYIDSQTKSTHSNGHADHESGRKEPKQQPIV